MSDQENAPPADPSARPDPGANEEHQYAPGDVAPVHPVPLVDLERVEYVGFWKRVMATIIDLLLYGLVSFPLLYAAYGKTVFTSDRPLLGQVDFIVSYILPAVVTVLFWHFRQATPGKMAISAIIVDARDGARVSFGRLVGRYFAYLLSALPLGLGFLWIAFDRRKQGWHDKLVKTVVIYEPY